VFARRLAEKSPQAQRVVRPPSDAALAVDAFELREQRAAEVHPGGEARPTHLLRVELAAAGFDEPVKPMVGQNLVHGLALRMSFGSKLLVRDEQLFLLAVALAHCHAGIVRDCWCSMEVAYRGRHRRG
jgi:hypothetical protein